MPPLKWISHADLAIGKTATVGREEYLDHMTFRRNDRPLFAEIFGPLMGLKEEWEEQRATSEELDFSAFRYRCEAQGHIPVNTGRNGGSREELFLAGNVSSNVRIDSSCTVFLSVLSINVKIGDSGVPEVLDLYSCSKIALSAGYPPTKLAIKMVNRDRRERVFFVPLFPPG